MRFNKIKSLLAQIQCPPFTIDVYRAKRSIDIYLQVSANLPDHATTPPGLMRTQHGRKWRLSVHMTRSEIVQTALAACLAFAEHEVRESFTYQGEAIFGPHFNIDDLAVLACNGQPEVRS